jgi:hypothetical protein
MLTSEEQELLRRHISIDGDGNVVGDHATIYSLAFRHHFGYNEFRWYRTAFCRLSISDWGRGRLKTTALLFCGARPAPRRQSRHTERLRGLPVVGRGRGSATRPTREVVAVYYRINAVERDQARLAAAQRALGWELQVTNAPPEQVTLVQATTLYREGGYLEHTFHKPKDRSIR